MIPADEKNRKGNRGINMEKQVVHVNGKAYDAVSGRRIDDIIAPKRSIKPVVAKKAAEQTNHKQQARAINHVKPHQAQHARTLMRHAVKHPGQGLKKQIHVQHTLAAQPAHAIEAKQSISHIDSDRLERAEHIEKSEQVSRFYSPEPVAATLAHVPVQIAPQDAPADEPPVAPPPVPTNKPADMFERAIENANHYVDIAARKSHLKKKARRHIVSMSTGSLALLLIAGFATYQNTPGLQIKLAGIRAGVATASHNFEAAGFAYNGTRTDQSRVVVGLKDAQGTYQLSEQATSWSGQDMASHVSAITPSGDPTYTTVQAGGQTVYRLTDTQATWVKNGTWYNVNGTKPLSEAQLRALVQNT